MLNKCKFSYFWIQKRGCFYPPHIRDQIVIDNAIDHWRLRLSARVRAEEGHFEESL